MEATTVKTQRGFVGAVEKVVNTGFILSAALLFLMSLPITLDVINRTAFGYSLPGIIELEELALMWIVFLAIAYPQFNESHISVDLLFVHLSQKFQNALELMHWICSTILVALMTWFVSETVVGKYNSHEFTPDLGIPLWIFYVLVVIALGLLTICFAISCGRAWKRLSEQRAWFYMILAIGAAIALLSLPYMLHDTDFSYSYGKVGSLYIGLLMLLILLKMPIAFAMSLCGLLGMMTISMTPAQGMILLHSTPSATVSFTLTVIPMFVLMGELVLYAGIGKMLFNTSRIWLGRLPGGLAISSVAGCAGFAAICGESLATALTMTSVALPEMKKYKYNGGLACAALAAGGTLGILIPPSIGFILYALMTEESVGRLFVAGVVPGLILTVLFCLLIGVLAWRYPELAPRGEKTSWKEKIASLTGILPMGCLVLLILGGILSGLFSPTEGGAIGVTGTLLFALVARKITWTDFVRACKSSADMTCRIMAILIGVHLLGNFFAMTQLPVMLADAVTAFTTNKYVVVLLVVIVYIILGMLMNVVPMVLLTLPAIYPTVLAMGFDPIWFGVIMVILMEMGAITPPVGLVVFAIAGASGDVPMASIFKYVSFFVLIQLLLIAFLTVFPEVVLFLPNYFYG